MAAEIVLLFFPLLLALLCWAILSGKIRSYLLPLGGFVHLVLSVYGFLSPAAMPVSPYLGLDAPARLVLPGVSLLFFICSIYAVGYLKDHAHRSNRVFCSSMLAFLSMMSLVAYARHLGLMWVAIEATTLSTAPLIYFNYNPKSIEATWKYLLICSVGIALALLGTFFLAYASMADANTTSLFMADLLKNAPHLSKPWLHAAFILLLVGYGTKMGLAPMHTWKPDAYGEASGLVGALLAGGLTQCAFLAIFRIFWICRAAGEGLYAGRFLIIMGLLSMAMAAAFIIHQRDFKRMLAYSSVEHMGILSLGLGLGGISTYGALLHLVNNGLTKGLLFLAAGNIAHAYGGKTLENVRGAIRRLPLSGTMFLLGFIAITGSPPFGPFVSEFLILNGAFLRGYLWVGALYLLFLLVVFMGMGGTVLAVVQGKAPKPAEGSSTSFRESFWSGIPLVFLALLILLLGIYIPGVLNEKVMAASHCLEQLYE
jgi:hydrogenase-4 component F